MPRVTQVIVTTREVEIPQGRVLPDGTVRAGMRFSFSDGEPCEECGKLNVDVDVERWQLVNMNLSLSGSESRTLCLVRVDQRGVFNEVARIHAETFSAAVDERVAAAIAAFAGESKLGSKLKKLWRKLRPRS